MNQLLHDHEPAPPGGRRASSRWWTVGLAGMTGLTLSAVGVTVAPAADAVVRTPTIAGDRSSTDDDRSQRNDRNHDQDRNRGEKNKDWRKQAEPKGVPIPCKADALIAAITLANARGGATLNLATKCTYTLTANIDGAGLPAITTPITLNGGEHTTITRAAAADQFRILTVDTGGNLTLNRLKITGGQAAENGGGISVAAGGSAVINHSKILDNITSQGGGGIFNQGTVFVTGSSVNRNVAGETGGGVSSSGPLRVVKSQIDRNTANVGGGVAAAGASVKGGSIAGNRAALSAGGMLIDDGIGTVVGTHVTGNTAGDAVGGIAVIDGGQLTLRRVGLTDNTAGSSGGLFVSGPISNGTSFAVIEDSLIKNNNAGSDGGGVSNQGITILRRATVAGNEAEGQGGGIYNTLGGAVRLFDTKVVKNVAVTDGGGIFNGAGGTVELNIASGTVVVKNRPDNCSGDVPGCAG
ncbi:autotransporter outer membrane beta-barrel domain-containing protein [Salinispora pacifica]|uniref:hypothetical protein n=1 Tax=Salinispora pacifica TaxID=351187 RepID=UPI00037E876A|nr:hypothetical protein [Salinispora pacifica]